MECGDSSGFGWVVSVRVARDKWRQTIRVCRCVCGSVWVCGKEEKNKKQQQQQQQQGEKERRRRRQVRSISFVSTRLTAIISSSSLLVKKL